MAKPKMRYRSQEVNLDYVKLSEAIEKLQELQKELPEDTMLDLSVTETYGEHYAEVSVHWKSEETPEELEARKAAEARQKEYRRKQFEALAEEFGG